MTKNDSVYTISYEPSHTMLDNILAVNHWSRLAYCCSFLFNHKVSLKSTFKRANVLTPWKLELGTGISVLPLQLPG